MRRVPGFGILLLVLAVGVFAGCTNALEIGLAGADTYLPNEPASTWIYDLEVTRTLGGEVTNHRGRVERRAAGTRLRNNETFLVQAVDVDLTGSPLEIAAFPMPFFGLVREADYRVADRGIWEMGVRTEAGGTTTAWREPRQVLAWPPETGRGFVVPLDGGRLLCLMQGREKLALLPRTFDDAVRFECEGHVRGPDAFGSPDLAVSTAFYLAPGAGLLRVETSFRGMLRVGERAVPLVLHLRQVLRELKVAPKTPRQG